MHHVHANDRLDMKTYTIHNKYIFFLFRITHFIVLYTSVAEIFAMMLPSVKAPGRLIAK